MQPKLPFLPSLGKRGSSQGLSTAFPAGSDMCYVRKDRNTILVATHKHGLYHVRVTPDNQKEAALATVDINLLHMMFHAYASRSISSLPPVLYSLFLIYAI